MSTVVRAGVIMNGVTGRMGRTQHLARSLAAIRAEGGVRAGDVVIWPDPVLVGRDEGRLRELAEAHGIERYSTDLTACLADERDGIYFDAQTTARREASLAKAIKAGKARLLREASRSHQRRRFGPGRFGKCSRCT